LTLTREPKEPARGLGIDAVDEEDVLGRVE
jgi:hypothetical protein